MNVLIFAAKIPRTGRPRGGIEMLPLSEMKRTLAGLGEETLVYIDFRGLAERDRRKYLAAAVKQAGRRVGVLDTEGRVKDVAALFHAGAVDYVGKALGAAALTARRLKAVAAHVALQPEATAPKAAPRTVPELAAPASGDGWASIREGREHTFAFLFIEVDDAEEMKKRYEPANLASAMETFRGFIERMVTPPGRPAVDVVPVRRAGPLPAAGVGMPGAALRIEDSPGTGLL